MELTQDKPQYTIYKPSGLNTPVTAATVSIILDVDIRTMARTIIGYRVYLGAWVGGMPLYCLLLSDVVKYNQRHEMRIEEFKTVSEVKRYLTRKGIRYE